MSKCKPMVMGWIVSVALLCGAVSALAQSKDELRARFEQRFTAVLSLKDQGQVGETFAGYVEAVTAEAGANAEVAKLLQDENTDRRKLYEIIANEQGVSVEQVATRNAARHFSNAKANHFLKTPQQGWKRKSELRS